MFSNPFPAFLSDDDEGIAEALHRDAELEANPDRAIREAVGMLAHFSCALDA